MKKLSEIIHKKVNIITMAYGLTIQADDIGVATSKTSLPLTRAGVALIHSHTEEVLIIYDFPVEQQEQINDEFLFVLSNGTPLSARFTYSVGDISISSSKSDLLSPSNRNGDYNLLLGNNGQRLLVHKRFRKNAVVKRYSAESGYGFLRRSHDVYFRKDWWQDNSPPVPGMEVTFIPVIASKKGIQAHAIREIVAVAG